MSEIDLISAFVVGLLGGVHCAGMCGGIVGALSFGTDASRRWPMLLSYNLGRLSSYTLAGAIMGALGFFFSGLLPVQTAQQVLLTIAAVFLILMGLYLAGWSTMLARVERIGGVLWRRIEPYGRRFLPVRTVGQGFVLGALWGWLPCGLVYSALVWTVSSGGAWQGAVLMLSFGLGTLPNLLLMGVAAQQLNRWVRHPVVRVSSGVLVAGFGLRLLIDAWGR
jgi:sulfite exporter TauE/SafE